MRSRILLYHGRGLLSAAIRLQTASDFSHASLLMPDGRTVIEAWQGAGVQRTTLTGTQGVSAFDVPDMSLAQWDAAIEFADAQVGDGYDYRGVFRFLLPLVKPSPRRWFCSELVFAACQTAGCDLLSRVEPYRVSPGMLSMSPLLVPASLALP